MSTPILDPKNVPTDWEKDYLGIVHPPLERMTLRFGPTNGWEIRTDGVYLIENDVKRKAEWPEDAQMRNMVMGLFGEEISRAAGIEPE